MGSVVERLKETPAMRQVVIENPILKSSFAEPDRHFKFTDENGPKFEDVQDAAGHANPSTTKQYDKRGYDPKKSASFFANYSDCPWQWLPLFTE